MKSSSKTIVLGVAAVAAVLLLALPAISSAQDQPGIADGTGSPENPFLAFQKYDANAPVRLSGTVTRLDWTNPLVRIYLETKGPTGGATAWAVQGYPPNTLRRMGVPGEAIKVGDMVTIMAYKAKDGSNTAGGYQITLADGSAKMIGPFVVDAPSKGK